MNRRPVVLVAALCGAALIGVECVPAAVVDAGSGGFTVSHELHVAATPTKVYADLVERVGSWWDPAHTFSGAASNLSIEARPQGCFCERLPDGGGVRHLTVVYADPGRRLRMVGGLGPLQSMAVAGAMDISLAADGDGTTVAVTYTVGGYHPGGLEAIAPLVDTVLGSQFERLKRYVETGRPTAGGK